MLRGCDPQARCWSVALKGGGRYLSIGDVEIWLRCGMIRSMVRSSVVSCNAMAIPPLHLVDIEMHVSGVSAAAKPSSAHSKISIKY